MDPDGITSIVATNVGGSEIEIDHVQFEDCTAFVPEPSALTLLAFGLLNQLAGCDDIVRKRFLAMRLEKLCVISELANEVIRTAAREKKRPCRHDRFRLILVLLT